METRAVLAGAVNARSGEPVRARKTTREVQDGVDPRDLGQAGWGILFAESDPRAGEITEALEPLLRLRKRQAGGLYRELKGPEGYRSGDGKLELLARHGAGPGRVNPKRMPYYLLIAGSPEQIPYTLQYGLDVHHAVGRIHFGTLEEYAAYAAAVAEAEKRQEPARRAVFFGPSQDESTELSVSGLLGPLAEAMSTRPGWQVEALLAEQATKQRLLRLLNDGEPPDLLFSASHALLLAADDPEQQDLQGALLCQEWPGWKHPVREDHYFAARDLGPARLQGLLAFLFACHSAGTPEVDDFVVDGGSPKAIAPRPFVSSLAQRLLGECGALAVVGHVERVWRASFLWKNLDAQPDAFAETLKRLADGGPLGWAMESLNQRHLDLVSSLSMLLEEMQRGKLSEREVLEELWIATRDARNYVIVGDPAVRLGTAAWPAARLRG